MGSCGALLTLRCTMLTPSFSKNLTLLRKIMGERNRRLRNDAALDQIRSHYLDLYALSIQARYELDPLSEI